MGVIALLACSGGLSSGAPESLRDALVDCDAYGGAARDGCAAQVVSSAEDISGADAWRVCKALDGTAHDRCTERAQAKGEPYAPDSACDSIEDELLRDSCWLAVADRTSLMAEDIADVVDACGETGSLQDYCLYHVPLKRWRRWNAGTDGAAELARLAEDMEGARESFAFGMGIARAVLRAGSRDTALCDAVAPGRASEVCRDGVFRNDPKALELGGGLPR